ncbi:adenosine deaminase-like protein [Bacillus rossius redtenbacheri]|uniref:adenosine deaminase-like protein n=1 Tax=Bacillus rossius redtenbacheri TaxID=93214 RepID=UPI002FDDCB03
MQCESRGDDDTPWDECEAVSHGDSRTLEECFSLFGVAHSLTRTPEAVRRATEDVIREFAEDGVVYLELRSTPREVPNVMTKLQYVKEVVKAIEKCSAEKGIVVKLLVSMDRRQGRAVAEETRALLSRARREHPGVVAGVDLSGDPAEGSVADYLPVLRACREEGLRTSLHCAEIPQPDEVRAILDFKPDRIGHATCIHPNTGGSEELWENLVTSGVPVEICLTSNVKCKTVDSYENHHFKFLSERRHPLSLCTDDKGVFATSLSTEFMIAAKTFHLSKEHLWKICFDSISFAFASEAEKASLREHLMKWKIEVLGEHNTAMNYTMPTI